MSNYPLNPTTQDTVNTMNLHVTAGVSSQSAMILAGPEMSLKFEYLFKHPFIFRSSFDLMFGKVDALNYPNGTIRRHSFSTEALYYRGTKKMTIYIGFGGLYGLGNFDLTESNYFENRINGPPQDISFSNAYGYRIILGMRIQHKYSIEVIVTEISPSFVYFNQTGTDSFAEEELNFRANYVKLSIGYLFKLK